MIEVFSIEILIGMLFKLGQSFYEGYSENSKFILKNVKNVFIIHVSRGMFS